MQPRGPRPWIARAPLAVALTLALTGCAKGIPVAVPDRPRGGAALDGPSPSSPAFGETSAVPVTGPRPVDPSLITHGTRPALFAREAVAPAAPACTREQRSALGFDHAPTYTNKIERDGRFSARLFVGNPAACTRKITVVLSFTPPKTTSTRTVELMAYVPPRGAFVELELEPRDLFEENITPGRYAITFAVLDEEGSAVGRALSGNPFRLGRDDISLVSRPAMPARIGASGELVVPFVIHNAGDTANHATPLVVFTRPGETRGIEHYEPPQLVLPGTSTYTLRLSAEARLAEQITPGSWLVTATMFDAGGDRLSSFAGMPLTIGAIDIRMTRPELPVRVKASAPLRATFTLDNRGDTPDRVTAIVAFTKPGTTSSKEFAFTRDVSPGAVTFEAVIEPALRLEKAVDKGIWLITTAAFRSSGERIKSFTGHYLEIVE